MKKQRFSLTALLAFVAALCVCVLFWEGKTVAANPDSGVPETSSSGDFVFPSKLRIATYNVCNFNDSNRIGEDGKFKYNAPKSEESKRAVYRTILAIRPDILAIQEIGGEAWLDELAAALAREGAAFPYRTVLNAYDEHNRLAILSRVPFSKAVKIEAKKKLTRGLLGVVVPLADGKMLYVYNVHLKSKRTSDPDDPESENRRHAEARYVRRLIEYGVVDEKTAEKIPSSHRFPVPARMKKNEPELFVLTGDFNEIPGRTPIAPLEAESFAQALDARDSGGGVFTYLNPKKGYFHCFDRIFVSPEIFKKYYVPASAKIADYPWAHAASDHRLVYADFDFLPPES